MNPGMPQYGMPSGASSGASSGAPYFNGWSPYGGFSQPSQGYGMSSPFGGFGGGYGMSAPFGGFGGGYGMPFQQMPMGGGKGGYSSPFGQFQTPNFAAKGGSGQPQSPASPATPNTPIVGHATGLPTNSGPPPIQSFSGPYQSFPSPNPVGSPPPNLGGGNYGQNPFGGLPTNMLTHQPGLDPLPPSGPGWQPAPASGSIPGYGGITPGVAPPLLSSPQPNAPIPQAVPPQMMNPVSGPAQMGPGVRPTGILPQQTFNQNRLPGANPIFPKRNMLIGGYR